jgi:hypothetical protein
LVEIEYDILAAAPHLRDQLALNLGAKAVGVLWRMGEDARPVYVSAKDRSAL